MERSHTPRPGVTRTLTLLGILLAASAAPAAAQERERCIPAERFLSEEMGFVVLTEPDTIDDWRTRQRVPGCRVTAARIATRSLGAEAEAFYETLRQSGWTRTPDPRDAPNESSLRFRLEQTDCLFNVYAGPIMGTPAELEVSTAVVPGPGERRFNMLVQCMPAMTAAPRGR